MNNNQFNRGLAYTLGISLLIAVFGVMNNRDREPESPKCPYRYGYQLIGSGHMEIDGERGELQCVYSTPPIYRDMVAGK